MITYKIRKNKQIVYMLMMEAVNDKAQKNSALYLRFYPTKH